MTTPLHNTCSICDICIHMCQKMLYHCLYCFLCFRFQATKHALVNVDLRVATAKKMGVFGVYLDDFRRPPVSFREWYSRAESILRDFLETEPGTESNEPKKSVTCNSLDSHPKSLCFASKYVEMLKADGKPRQRRGLGFSKGPAWKADSE